MNSPNSESRESKQLDAMTRSFELGTVIEVSGGVNILYFRDKLSLIAATKTVEGHPGFEFVVFQSQPQRGFCVMIPTFGTDLFLNSSIEQDEYALSVFNKINSDIAFANSLKANDKAPQPPSVAAAKLAIKRLKKEGGCVTPNNDKASAINHQPQKKDYKPHTPLSVSCRPICFDLRTGAITVETADGERIVASLENLDGSTNVPSECKALFSQDYVIVELGRRIDVETGSIRNFVNPADLLKILGLRKKGK